jgi:hypothetical protein
LPQTRQTCGAGLHCLRAAMKSGFYWVDGNGPISLGAWLE